MPRIDPNRPWRKWYVTKRWVRRREQQRRERPLCEMCLEHGVVIAAQVVDHVMPHHGDYHLFWYGKLQSLCKACHDSSKQQIENKGFVNDIGTDGWPVDPGHPVYVYKNT
jgi:5-methylcytosine-specific restriction enzyme A